MSLENKNTFVVSTARVDERVVANYFGVLDGVLLFYGDRVADGPIHAIAPGHWDWVTKE